MVDLKNGTADVLLAPTVLKVHSFFQLDLKELPLPHMGILVECHRTPLLDREVGVPHIELLGVIGDAMDVDGVSIDGPILEGDEEGSLRLGGLLGGAEDGVSVMDEVTGGDEGSGDGDGVNELSAQDIVVLDMENDEGEQWARGILKCSFHLGSWELGMMRVEATVASMMEMVM